MAKWQPFKFSDFLQINPTVSLKGKESYSFIEMKDLDESQRFAYPSQERILTGGARFAEGDTLFARITPCLENGKICQAKSLKNGVGFGSTEFLVFRERKGISDKDFIFYLSRWEEVRRYAELHLVGTSGRQRVPKDVFDKLELNLPDLPTQQKIAEILSSLDDKIEVNRRMNQTLEQMAQTLFRQYFVEGIDVDNLPEGWELGSLDEIANFLNGIALQKFKPKDEKHTLPIIKIRELKNGITSSTESADVNIPAQYIIEDGEVLFSWSGTLEADLWCHGKGALNQHLFKVTSDKFPKWYYFLWVREHLKEFKSIAASKATTMGHIQRHHLKEAEVFIPSSDFLAKYDSVFEPLIDKMINARVESRKLRETRDTLLPKLMSGEIDVMQTQTAGQYEEVLS